MKDEKRKQDFISMISSMNREELNSIIEKKGKKQKKVNTIVISESRLFQEIYQNR